jgi:nucleotide-binding universal stress UspA family protein
VKETTAGGDVVDYSAPDPGRRIADPAAGDAVDVAVVLVGLDGSTTSWHAFWWACGEARRLGGRAVAVLVTRIVMDGPVAGGIPAYPYRVTDYGDAVAARLLAETRRHAIASGVDVSFMHTYGDPATQLAHMAQAINADLVVVGRSTGLRHRLFGSIGRRLVGGRDAPVVVVVP